MWIKSQNKERLINLNRCAGVKIDFLGNVGRIWACQEVGEGLAYLLGEYRDYAAKKIFDEIALLLEQTHTYSMPDEHEANEKYKEAE